MVRLTSERVLLIGDSQRQVHAALEKAVQGVEVTAVPTYFDAIAELADHKYTAVLASVEPIERRPEPAVKTLRRLAADARLLLFGHPTLEPLSRKMMEFGCDDYIITPAEPGELQQVFLTPHMRIAPEPLAAHSAAESEAETPQSSPNALADLSLADLFLAALQDKPNDAPSEAIRRLNAQLRPTMSVSVTPISAPPPDPADGRAVLSHPIRSDAAEVATLHLNLPADQDPASARHFLANLAQTMARLQALQDRHNRLQRMAITDDLTGLYNSRYFKHFFAGILEKARKLYFPVTLFIFDIDNFKHYNDQFGHGAGDEILKQTAALIKRCVREHDHVARLGGDEFAVVFWEKEGPRQVREGHTPTSNRPPQTPEQVLERFRRLVSSEEFACLGPAGRGTLTISGGTAVAFWEGQTMEELIAVADRKLMFGAKRAGKNSIFLIGGEAPAPANPSAESTVQTDRPA